MPRINPVTKRKDQLSFSLNKSPLQNNSFIDKEKLAKINVKKEDKRA